MKNGGVVLKYNKTISLLSIFSIACFLLLSVGFFKGAISVLKPKKSSILSIPSNEDEPAIVQEKKLFVALGDSLTRGIGDKEGKGYTDRVKAILKSNYKQEVVLSNLAISGATTNDLLKELEKKNVIETIAESDAIFLTIGGNDLFPGADNISQEMLATYKPDEETFQKNLNQIISKIRKVNKNLPIYAFGYYNPFHNVPGLDVSSSLVLKWNTILEQSLMLTSNAYMIPTFDIFYNQENSYLYTDHFHPNADGYTQMANRLSNKIGSQMGGQ